ncbi:MAG: SDR family oxidoreductase [Actinobacteria bacterium]|nr:SDR family oxidoreductase [Actinomycetota bacterium]
MSSVVVITGAASGIGKGIAKKMANGYSLVLVDVNSISLNVVAEEIRKEGAIVSIVVGDVSLRETHKKSVAEAAKIGTLTGWVNCAGIGGVFPLHALPENQTDVMKVLEVNQIGTMWGCAEAVKSFTDSKVSGSIVNISSVHGRRAYLDHAVYEMTKAAIDALTRNAAVVYGPYGIRTNSVAPGAVMSEAMEQSFVDAPDPQGRRQWLEMTTPLKRIAQTSEIAEVVEFLISPRSSYLTGQSICVDGGWTASLGISELDQKLALKYGLNEKTGLPNKND